MRTSVRFPNHYHPLIKATGKDLMEWLLIETIRVVTLQISYGSDNNQLEVDAADGSSRTVRFYSATVALGLE